MAAAYFSGMTFTIIRYGFETNYLLVYKNVVKAWLSGAISGFKAALLDTIKSI
jgi:hypothetical protein